MRRLGWPLLLLVLMGPLVPRVHGQVDEEDLGEIEMEIFAPREPEPIDPEWDVRLRDAEFAFYRDDPRGALAALEPAIEQMAPLATAANPSPEGRALLARGLLLRAQLRIDQGDTAGAVDDLRRAVQVQPALDVDRERHSAPLLAQFDAIRNEMIGTLDLEVVDPADLELRIDDRRIQARNDMTGPLPVLAGSRTLRARRPGYTSYAVNIEVPAGATVPVAVALERTGPVLRLVTRPAGAVIALDGAARGVTQAPPARVAPPRTTPGSPPPAADQAFSSPFLMANVPLGHHRLEVTLDGYRPFRAPLTIAEAIDYEVPPIVLEREMGRLLLRGMGGDARVRIDGREVAVTRGADRSTVELAPGIYEIMVDRGPAAMFTRELRVADRQTIEIDVRLRPGLGLLGVLGNDADAAARVNRILTDAVGQAGRWTLVDHGARVADVLADTGVSAEALRGDTAAATVDWTGLQQALDRRDAGLLYVLPVLSDDLLATHVDFWIFPAAPGPARPDRVRLALADADAVARMARLLSRSVQIQRPWLGAQVIDSAGAKHPVVVTVTDGSPAAAAGLRVGDEVVSVASSPTARARDLEQRVVAAEIGEPLALAVRGPGGNRTVSVTLGSSPVIIDHLRDDRLYAVAYADLTLMEREVPDGETWVVQLNRAKVFLHVQDWIGAARELRTIEPPAAPVGVGQASIDYWLGIALSAAGPSYHETAIDALERASAQPNARLFHNDGPWLAPRARARLHALATER